jgi:putative endonuclease
MAELAWSGQSGGYRATGVPGEWVKMAGSRLAPSGLARPDGCHLDLTVTSSEPRHPERAAEPRVEGSGEWRGPALRARGPPPAPRASLSCVVAKRMYVYFLASDAGYLYIGVTSDLVRRVAEHRAGIRSGSASRFHASRLVYWEPWDGPRLAISREKQLKRWSRGKKELLIAAANPQRADLAEAGVPIAPPYGFRWARNSVSTRPFGARST